MIPFVHSDIQTTLLPDFGVREHEYPSPPLKLAATSKQTALSPR
jgi:hypothetical protein